MTGDIGTYTIDHIDGKHELTYKGPSGYLRFNGSDSACQRQVEEWHAEFCPGKLGGSELTRDSYLQFINEKLEDIKDTIQRKNADYTGGSDSPFANFEVTARLGLSDAKTGVLIRMVDKIQRIKSYISKGSLQVKNESVDDAAMDIIGYSLVLLGMLEDDRRKGIR